jgi:hypothetical protein
MTELAMTPIVPRALGAILLLSLSAALTPAYADMSALPPVRTQGDVTYLSGGIGSDETAAIKAAAPGYALTLQFSSATGAFLASVVVKITDADGTVVLDTTSEGPYLLVNLGPGRYTVDAMLDDVERTADVTIEAGSPQKRSLVWPPRKADTEPKMRAPSGTAPVATRLFAPDDPVVAANLPAQRRENGVTYITGGIGSDESEAMKAAASKYAVALTFASEENGQHGFLASVPVQIVDESGTTVLDVTTAGPYLLMDLPPGRYEVVATHQGAQQRSGIEVEPNHCAQRTFTWTR